MVFSLMVVVVFVQILEVLQLLGCQWLLQQRASTVGTLVVVKRHVVDALHVRL